MARHAHAADTAPLLARLWPVTAPSACGVAVQRLAGPPAGLRLDAGSGGPPLDVDPVSGDVFVGGRRLDTGPEPRPSPDLWLRLRRRRNPRDAVALVYRGTGAGLADFIGACLPAIFALDVLDPECRAIAQLPLRLARRGFVQDAMEDGLFRPRRVEIMNPRKLVAARSVLLPAAPPPDAGFLSVLWRRLDAIYPEPAEGEHAIALCAGGAPRAASLGLCGPVIDPETLRLDRLVTALRAADAITGPDTGELAAAALAGPGPRRVRAVAAGGDARGLDGLATAAGWAYERSDQPASRP
jgi:hypothetical protein